MSKKMEEFLNKVRQNQPSRDEILQKLRDIAGPMESYRLEAIYDSEKNTLTLQGDQRGMEILNDIITGLKHIDTPAGNHTHLDEVTYLTKANVKLVIQRVD